MNSFPSKMRALQIEHYHEHIDDAFRGLHVTIKPVPILKHGQVLVKVLASPCNPSDLLFLQGRYGKRKTLPAVPGWEGVGIVVAANSLLGKWLVGKRVAFSNQNDSDGAWVEYCAVDAKACIPLKNAVSTEQGACLIINPLTALGLVDTALKKGHRALIQTAAASQVGRMVLALAREKNIPAIHIVRRSDQETLLKAQGADIVMNSETPSFASDLQEIAHKLNATIAFDAIAGSMTGTLLHAMPSLSQTLVYGSLSGTPSSHISALDLIFQQKSIEGFYLTSWIENQNLWQLYKTTNQVQKLIADGTIHTEISKEVTFDETPQALQTYQHNMTTGKILIKP